MVILEFKLMYASGSISVNTNAIPVDFTVGDTVESLLIKFEGLNIYNFIYVMKLN